MLGKRAGLSRIGAVVVVIVIVAISSIGAAYFYLSPTSSSVATTGESSNTTITAITTSSESGISTFSTLTGSSAIQSSSTSITTSKSSSSAKTSTALSCANVAPYNMTVPLAYATMYSTLNQILGNFNQTLISTPPVGANHQVIYATELLPADSNLVTALLVPGQLQSVENNLNAMQTVGVQGVTIDVSYPILSPTFANYSQYLSFYENVVQQVRDRGMKIDIESQTPLLVGYPGINTGNLSYSNLSRQVLMSHNCAR